MASRPKPGQRARFTGASISESLSFAKTASDSVDGRPVMLVTGPAGDETGRAGVPGGAVGILERATEGDGAWRWDESELTKRERRAVVAAKPPPVIAGECRYWVRMSLGHVILTGVLERSLSFAKSCVQLRSAAIRADRGMASSCFAVPVEGAWFEYWSGLGKVCSPGGTHGGPGGEDGSLGRALAARGVGA